MIEFITGAVFLYILFIVVVIAIGIIVRIIPEKPYKATNAKKYSARGEKATEKWESLPYAEGYREFKEINSKDDE